MNILVSWWRSYVALELIRILKDKNNVFVCDSLEKYICQYSRYPISFVIPSPRYDFKNFKRTVLQIIKRNSISIVLPTCEDIFYFAQIKTDIEELWCRFLWESFEKLTRLHSKNSIMKMCEWLWINIPLTKTFTAQAELYRHIQDNSNFWYVVKPEYSRFASQISSNKFKSKSINEIDIDLQSNSYVLQEYIEWENICSYSIFDQGNIVSSICYKWIISYKHWSQIYFESYYNDKINNFLHNFWKQHKIEWQISFDYKVNKEWIYLLECNPRATSGVHLFKSDIKFQTALQDYLENRVSSHYIPANLHVQKTMVIPLILSGPRLNKLKEWTQWMNLFKDIIFDKKDLYPFFAQFWIFLHFLYLAWKKNKNIIQIMTEDIEFDW